MPLAYKIGHLYVQYPLLVNYAETELRRIHRHFYDTHAQKRVSWIHQGGKEYATSKLRAQLEHVRRTCDPCQRLAKEPAGLRVAMQNENCIFNRLVGMGIMEI